jgi:hypothetical protein
VKSKWSKAFWRDLGERVASTFIASFIPVYVAAANVAHLDWVNAVEISGTAAGLSLLKGLAANLASPESGPSLLSPPPGPVETDAPDRGAVDALFLVAVAVLVVVVLLFFGFHGHH